MNTGDFWWQHGLFSSLEPEKVVHLVGQGREVGVDATEDVKLRKQCLNINSANIIPNAKNNALTL